jgi:predicted aspartyl protease
MTSTTLALLALFAAPAELTITAEGFAVAPVSVNGSGPYTLIVDTAAGASALFPPLAEALQLDPKEAGRVSVQGASGVRQAALHRVGPVETAGVKVGSLNVVELDASHLFSEGGEETLGILGADFLLGFDVELDFAAGEMRLGESTENAPKRSQPFEHRFGRFLIIPVKVNGADVTAVVDTGARRTLLNWKAAHAAGLTVGDERLIPDEPVRGATTDRTEAWSFVATSFEGGGARWSRARLGVAELPVFAALGLGDEPAMILGVNLLADRSLRIDYDEKRLLIGPPVAATR